MVKGRATKKKRTLFEARKKNVANKLEGQFPCLIPVLIVGQFCKIYGGKWIKDNFSKKWTNLQILILILNLLTGFFVCLKNRRFTDPEPGVLVNSGYSLYIKIQNT